MYSTGLSREERGAGIGGGDRVRSLKETAALLGISIATLRRMIAAGGWTDHYSAVAASPWHQGQPPHGIPRCSRR